MSILPDASGKVTDNGGSSVVLTRECYKCGDRTHHKRSLCLKTDAVASDMLGETSRNILEDFVSP